MSQSQNSQKIGLGATRSEALATGTAFVGMRGVHCNVAGTITGKLQEDTADGDYVVAAGIIYPLCFKSITTLTNATGRILY